MTALIPLLDPLRAEEEGSPPAAWVLGSPRSRWEFKAEVERVRSIARSRDEGRWLLACEEAWDFAAGLLGLLRAGKVVVIPPNLLPGTREALKGEFHAVLSRQGASVRLSPEGEGGKGEGSPVVPGDPRGPVIELFTSGTTGAPKRVVKRFAQLESEAAALENAFGDRVGGSRVVATVPHHHIYGLLFRIIWPLHAGRPFVCENCSTPDSLAAELGRPGRVVLVSSPSLISRFPDLLDLPRWRGVVSLVFSSGGPLAAEPALRLAGAVGQAPVEVFGSTETGGVAWRQRGTGADDDLWDLLPGVRAQRGPDGALAVVSPFTGGERVDMADSVEILPGGKLRLGARLDRIVKVGEKRVSLPEMEGVLREHPLVSDAAVVLIRGARSTLGAAVVLAQPSPSGHGRAQRGVIAELRVHLARRFEGVVLPRRWRFPSSLPYNERGKLNPAEMEELFSQRPKVGAGGNGG